jgi:hypothetical protein
MALASEPSKRRVGKRALLALLVFGEAALGHASNDVREPPRTEDAEIKIPERRRTPFVVKLAILDARRRLDRPQCQKVFSEFADSSGHALKERLETLDRSAKSYLDGMVFSDGEGRAPCLGSDALATTAPGSRVVFICGGRFTRRIRTGLAPLAIIVIHEELHSLGLRENPPSSAEITRRVALRCGDGIGVPAEPRKDSVENR